MKKLRTWFAADKTGFLPPHVVSTAAHLFQCFVRYDGGGSLRRCWSTTARYVVWSLSSWLTGRIETILADAVTLCTGGCGQASFTTNADIKTGDGTWALAFRHSALKDMEFVYAPTGLPSPGS